MNISVGSCKYWICLLGSTSYSMYFTSKVIPNTAIPDLQLLPKQVFLNESIALPVVAASLWWHCCSRFDRHSCSRGVKRRHSTSSALVSTNSNLLLLPTEQRFPVPPLGTPSVPATGNSLHDLNVPVIQEVTLSHHHVCLLNDIVGGYGQTYTQKNKRVFTAQSLLWVKCMDHARRWLFPCLCLEKSSCGQTTVVQLLSVHWLIYYHCKFQKSHLKGKHPTQEG